MSLTVIAHAKVNLTLEALGERDDGYHEVVSVLQTVDLADTLSFCPGDGLRLGCGLPWLASEENSVMRAAELLRAETGCGKGAWMRLEKRIPSGGGLGGHSADAAAARLRRIKLVMEVQRGGA